MGSREKWLYFPYARVQFESPHSVEGIRQARARVSGPFSFMGGKPPPVLEPRRASGPGRAYRVVSRVHHKVMYAALWDFMQNFGHAVWRPGRPFRPVGMGVPIRTRCVWTSGKPSPSSTSWRNAI